MLAGGVPDLNTFHGFGHGDFSVFFKEMDWMNWFFRIWISLFWFFDRFGLVGFLKDSDIKRDGFSKSF